MNRKHNPPASLIGRLEQDYTRQLQTSAAEEIAALREILGPYPLPEHKQVAVNDSTTVILVLVLLMLIPISFLCWYILFDEIRLGGSFPWKWTAISLGMSAGSLIYTYICVMSFLKRHTPLYVISLAGIQFRDEPRLIPWAAVDDFSVTKVKYSMGPNTWIITKPVAVLHLRRDYRINWSFSLLRPATYDRKRHLIMINVGSRKYVNYICQYHAQYRARARLAELGEQV